jgi:hypothetical protein
MSEKNTGRPAGARNRNSWKVLNKLKDHDFDIIDEVMDLYGYSKQIYTPLFKKAMDNINKNLPVVAGMVQEDVDAMNAAGKSMGDILGKLMAYCYPKLTAVKVDTGATDKINFSITIPVVEKETKK